MANVSSWADIVEALNGATGDITLNLTQDINLYYEVDYVYGIRPLYIPDGCNLTIEGNGHQIINLTNDIDTIGGIFMTNSLNATSVELRNVDFVNLVLNNAALVYCKNTEDELEVYNCGFEGKRYGTSYLFDSAGLQGNFIGCFFDIPWIGTGQNPQKYTSLVTNAAGSSGTANVTNYEAKYCWFREHYTNWTIKTWSYTNVNKTDNSTLWSFFFIKLNGCYIDGDMTMTNDNHSGHSTHIPIDVVHHPNRVYIPTKMSFFDVNVSCIGTRTIADYGSFFGLYINKLYNENNQFIANWELAYDTSSGGNYPRPIIATQKEAASENWLRDSGFAI